MEGHIDGLTKKERTKKLLELSEKLEENYYKSQINKKEKVLIEKEENGYYYGHTSNYLYLKLKGNYQKNEIYEITIDESLKAN